MRSTAPIIHWPNRIEAKGEVRSQFHHVIDVAPTVLEAAGIPEPTFGHGIPQEPYEGVSMAYSFNAPEAAERHETQYFEMFVNRGIYHKGWTAVTRHSTPWVVEALPPFDDDACLRYLIETCGSRGFVAQSAAGTTQGNSSPAASGYSAPAGITPRQRPERCSTGPDPHSRPRKPRIPDVLVR